jgi:hypothetical protein
MKTNSSPRRRTLAWTFTLAAILVSVALASRLSAQSNDTARLTLTVVDPSGGGIPTASITLTGNEEATRRRAVAPVTANASGVAVLESLTPGRYAIQASFAGFEPTLLRDVTLRRGENRQMIVLALKKVNEEVQVGGGQEGASSRQSAAFGRDVAREEIDTLSDDPAELQRQLLELAGPDAIIRVDSFEGAQLPPKSQIKSVHITRDQFAAEAPYPGSTFVDIITQPGVSVLAGGLNIGYRGRTLSGRSPFVSSRQPEDSRTYNGNLSGTFLKERGDFSVSMGAQRQFTTPILNQGGSAAELVNLRQRFDYVQANAIVNYALTRDQTLRLGYAMARQFQKNLGVGAYDSPERAFSTDFTGWQIRALEAGPLGRRTFHNTRVNFTSIDQSQRSAVEAPTIIIQEHRITGGAQVRGGTKQRTYFLASDVDYIRGIHSWRAGFQSDGGWFDSDMSSGYLGTYTFASAAAFDANQPMLFTQTVGDPRVKYFNAQTAAYIQDDIRVSKALTFSPGVRYLVQTHVKDWSGLAPRFGMTWSPFKSGQTTFRLSAGLFYWPMEMARVYEQTLRYDGLHQQQVIVVNPSYPNPGAVNGLPPNKYVLGDFSLQRNLRYSAGVDHRFTPRLRANVLYAYWHQYEFWGGRNLNAPVDGVRPDPSFANILEAFTQGEIRRHDLTVTMNASLLVPSPAANAALFNWRRLSATATYGKIRAWQTGDGPFTPSPTGSQETEWNVQPQDVPYRLTAAITSTQLRNLNVNLSWTANSGTPYTITTGVDDNGDGVLNDRPFGTPLRSLRTADQSTLNLRVGYMATTGGAGPSVPGQHRYRVGVSLNAMNLTNRANYGGYSGNMTSLDFMTPTLVVNPRRVEMSLNLGF